MIVPLLMASVLAAGPVRVRVEVKEYITQKPVPGAEVILRDQQAATGSKVDLNGRTDADGRIWFETAHLQFAPFDVRRNGYVSRAELQPFRGEFKTLERPQPRGGEELFWTVWLVPRAWWQQNMKAVTPQQAVAIASEWGRDCGPAAKPPSVRHEEKERAWLVDYDCMQVLVRPMSGKTILRVHKPVTGTPLYPPEDALADALSSPLSFIGLHEQEKGRIPACAFRNDKVFVINRYCTVKEIHSTGLRIIHPERGVAFFYAEAKAPISQLHRDDYEQWKVEVMDPLPGLRLSMGYEALRRHEERRLRLTDQSCSAGFGVREEVTAGCYNKSAEVERWWAAKQDALLQAPPASWYQLLKRVRSLAARRGKPDPRGLNSEPVEAAQPIMPSGAPQVGSGPARVIIEVIEYYTHKPVAGARVVLKEYGGARELVGTTGSDGKVRFGAPHLHFDPLRVEKTGLVPPEELEAVWSAFKSLDHRKNRRGAEEVAWTIPVVNRTWLDANMKARTRGQALARAQKWGAECRAGGPVHAEFEGQQWTFTYPCMIVRVDPWTGRAGARKTTPREITSTPLYPPQDALADALSSPLQHVGTGAWFGFSIPSCVYRNARVFVVNRYCTFKEINPTKITVIHPERGVVSFRAEGDHDRPVSTLRRDQYSEWNFSSKDPFAGLQLRMGAEDLVAWDRKRQRFHSTPGCGAGLSTSAKERGSCAQKTPEVKRWWDGVYPTLLGKPPEDWYTLVKTLRDRALKDWRTPTRSSDSK